MQTTANTSSRTWKATVYAEMDRVVVAVQHYIIRVVRVGDEFVSATINGVAASIERAARLLTSARDNGVLEMIERVEPSIGTRAAASLHRAMARLGLTRNGQHYQTATEALERPVVSLATLSPEEAQTTYGYACSLVGLSSRVWAA